MIEIAAKDLNEARSELFKRTSKDPESFTLSKIEVFSDDGLTFKFTFKNEILASDANAGREE